MKFSLYALLGCTTATTVTLPTFSYNSTIVDGVANDFQDWAQRNEAATAEDNRNTTHDVANAWATYRVSEYTNFGKNFKPIVDATSDFLATLNVNAECDQAVAAECLTKYMLGQFQYQYDDLTHRWTSPDKQMETCIKTDSNCTMDFERLTHEQQHALADNFETSVDTMAQAYQTYQDQLINDI